MMKQLSVVFLLAALAAACAVNPVTGKHELSLYSEAQEIQMGKQTDTEVAAQYGVYDDAALSKYVGSVGSALAAKSQRPSLPWRFTVLDSPVVNAFAVPGGSVYITRGILAMMNSEAELAAVLGHEIGHVNAKHSVHRMSEQTLAQVGLVAGSVVSKEFAKYAGLASAGLQVLFLKYSRDDERQADSLGVTYARAASYNPADMAVTFAALQKMGDLQGGRSLPGFLSTHPLEAERIKNVQAMLKPGDEQLARKPEPYLQAVNNVIYGDDPRQGYVENSMFFHPVMRFQFAVPSGWTVDNTPAQVTLVAADQSAGLIFQGGKSDETAEQFARKQATEIQNSGGKLLG
ncbi:MAG TPA: M48 family metallopeptidase, partial [Burkholderiales bacterium]|nr:M48 family metallopeptidase [Burkholderiales bacterium]